MNFFCMNENESVDIVTRFTKITNDLAFLGDSIDNDQKVRKIIQTLPLSCEVKSTTLKEVNDKEEMEFIGLIGNLKTHEMKKSKRREDTSKEENTCLQVYSNHL